MSTGGRGRPSRHIALAPLVAHADKNLDKSGAWDCKNDPVAHLSNGS